MKKIYGFLVLIFCIACFTNPLKAQWVQTSTPAPGQIECIAVNGNDLFEGNGQGQVFHSTDDGVSWTDVTNNLSSHAVYIGSIAYDGTNLLAADFDGGGIFLSTNKGANWTPLSNGITDPWINTLTISGGNFYAGTTYGEVFVSTNSGANWSMIGSAFCNSRVLSVAASPTHLYASTQSNGVFRSVIGDTTWTGINSGLPAGTLVTNLVVSGSSLFGAAYGTNGGVCLSTNNGDTWTLPSNQMISDGAFSLYIYPPTKGTTSTNLFAGTMDNEGIFLSTDNGVSWQSEGLAIPFDGIIDIKEGNSKLFALTVGQEIWRRPLSEMINGINEISGSLSSSILQQNYPNPFTAQTTISWRQPTTGYATLTVLDFTGREVATVLDGLVPAGIHSVSFDATGLTPGVYGYRILTGVICETRKMIVN